MSENTEVHCFICREDRYTKLLGMVQVKVHICRYCLMRLNAPRPEAKSLKLANELALGLLYESD